MYATTFTTLIVSYNVCSRNSTLCEKIPLSSVYNNLPSTSRSFILVLRLSKHRFLWKQSADQAGMQANTNLKKNNWNFSLCKGFASFILRLVLHLLCKGRPSFLSFITVYPVDGIIYTLTYTVVASSFWWLAIDEAHQLLPPLFCSSFMLQVVEFLRVRFFCYKLHCGFCPSFVHCLLFFW